MKHLLVYAVSLSWGIIPGTRNRLARTQRWPGVMASQLKDCHVYEDCLNGRTTIWQDPNRPGRHGLDTLPQTLEKHAPLELVILLLGTNDMAPSHNATARESAGGIKQLAEEILAFTGDAQSTPPKVLIICPPCPNPKGPMLEKLAGARTRAEGMVNHYKKVAEALDCAFFDSASVISVSQIDGVHLDAPEHKTLGLAASDKVNEILG